MDSKCLEALEAITDPYSQIARIYLLILQIIQFVAFIKLAKEYKRKRIALHGNLKFLYINLMIVYNFGVLSVFLIELRHIILSIFYANFPCSMLTPLWYVFLSRGFGIYYTTAIPLLHFAIMVERWQATRLVSRYELAGNNFGIVIVSICYIVDMSVVLVLFYFVLNENGGNLAQLVPYNTLMKTKGDNLLSYFPLIVLIILTAAGDFYVYVKNVQLLKNMKKYERKLSEKYQIYENLKAIKMIFPLDILYLIFSLLYTTIIFLLRYYCDQISLTTTMAHYNVAVSMMTIYAIVSCIFCRNCLLSNSNGKIKGNKVAAEVTIPIEQMGQFYFDQLKNQWN